MAFTKWFTGIREKGLECLFLRGEREAQLLLRLCMQEDGKESSRMQTAEDMERRHET